jgi:hypothetical protein
MNSKGQGFNEIMAIAYIIVLAFMTISIVFLAKHTSSLFVDTSGAELDSLYNFIIYSKEGISYYDPLIDRTYPGLVEESTFFSGRLDESMKFHEANDNAELPGARLTLTNLETGASKEMFWNEKWFNRLDKKTGLLGSGSPNHLDRSINVNIKSDEDYSAILRIEMVVPR